MTPEDVPDGPLLVDTDVISYWFLHQHGAEFSKLVSGHELAVSFASYGELLATAYKSRWGSAVRSYFVNGSRVS